MSFIPEGDWAIECVLINQVTVMNNEGMRAVEVKDDAWVIQPAGQRFRICQSTAKSAVLESNGEVFYADYEVDGNKLLVDLSRRNIKEVVSFEAVAITADVFASLTD